MGTPTIRGIKEETLSSEERVALAILRNLSVEKVNQLKALMSLGDPGVIGPQTLAMFRSLCAQHGFELSEDGVNVFKDSLHLGNTGDLRGVVGPQTAAVYYDELIKRISGAGEFSLEKKLLAITGTFEGRGFANVTGDFDGQGISFGILQWNFGQGSLPPLLKQMTALDPAKFREIFGDDTDRFRAVLDADWAAQLEFARDINDSRDRVIEPWRTRFIRLGEYPPFQDVQVQLANSLLTKARALARDYGLNTERGLALMFDIVVQNGSIRPVTRARILEARSERERALGRSLTEREFLELIAVKRADDSDPRWHDDVLARKLCIVRGAGRVHGRFVDLEEEFGLSDAPFA